MLTAPYNYTAPDFMPEVSSPLLTGADFSSLNLTDPFFETVTYRGAFGNTDWTSDWTNFDCENTDYTTGIKETANSLSAVVYPNPVDASSQLKFQLKASTSIVLDIIDASGRLVSTMQYTHLNAGYHTLPLTTHPLQPGFYTLRIQSAQGSSIMKIATK